jgi:F-type H+-transporting ATPase subunit epsilon
MGVYPQHVPLMTQLTAGEIIVRKNGQESYLAVGDGFVQITGDRVAILTDMATSFDQIDEVKVEEARKRAEARLNEQIDSEECAAVQASLANAVAQLHVKRRRQR